MRQAIQEAGGELVAGTGGVQHARHRCGRNLVHHAVFHDHAALGRARQGGDAAPLPGTFHNAVEVFRLEQRRGFVFVGEQDVHILVEKMQELVAEAADAEAVGQGQRDTASCPLHGGDGLARGVLGGFLVPQIAFDIEDTGLGHVFLVHVIGGQLAAGAQIGIHAALAVRRHRDQAGGGGGTLRGGHAGKGDALFGHGLGEDLAQTVIEHLAEIDAGAAQRGQARQRVGGAAAGHFVQAGHGLLIVGQCLQQLMGAEAVNQRHAALGDLVGEEEPVIHRGDDINNGVADPGNIVFVRHGTPQLAREETRL